MSTGLLNNMSQEEAEAVLGHEVSHVANGDMVTLALIQGVLNTFVIFLSRVDRLSGRPRGVQERARLRSRLTGSRSSSPQIVLGILASMIVDVVLPLARVPGGRRRRVSSPVASKMIAALERLKLNHEQSTLPEQVKAFGISGGGGYHAAVHVPSAAGGAHRGIAGRAGSAGRVSPVRRA